MHGWFGKILRGDWSSGKIKAETLDPTVARNYIGAGVSGSITGATRSIPPERNACFSPSS